ncbi:uncharacterized protein FOMMEDRAFT_156006 [Fomitiporia mediterranea MF3/22]|uniref:uncharacterized protein n=1 Tax=Fomitiporia mediterranea (strain MF3/22) TaxID=694068 RepID=UPI0004408E1D|nr:uncharacterized protein FOMMEDRAFT_156006 [Fomitiporia mediterranea MF3/22]EJD02676.1 hypothetical protein FOMMEDRAFT_156006 [Fomitiporia mediterranea MF3/22]
MMINALGNAIWMSVVQWDQYNTVIVWTCPGDLLRFSSVQVTGASPPPQFHFLPLCSRVAFFCLDVESALPDERRQYACFSCSVIWFHARATASNGDITHAGPERTVLRETFTKSFIVIVEILARPYMLYGVAPSGGAFEDPIVSITTKNHGPHEARKRHALCSFYLGHELCNAACHGHPMFQPVLRVVDQGMSGKPVKFY